MEKRFDWAIVDCRFLIFDRIFDCWYGIFDVLLIEYLFRCCYDFLKHGYREIPCSAGYH